MVAGFARDPRYRIGPSEPVLARLDPLLMEESCLSPEEFESLVAFMKHGLLDARARKTNLCKLLPASVPSGLPTMRFEGCPDPRGNVFVVAPSAAYHGKAAHAGSETRSF